MKGFLGSGSGPTSKSTGVDTLIGRQTEVNGDVRFAGGLHVDGRIKGAVSGTDQAAALSVSDSGIIEGNVRVGSAIVNGTIIGDLRASERLVLNTKARITGTVIYKVLQMEPGATINGPLQHDSNEPAALSHQSADRQDAAILDIGDARRSNLA